MRKLLIVSLFLFLSTSWAINVKPVDDYSAYCDDKDCVVSYKYMHDLTLKIQTQRATIDALFIENQNLRSNTIERIPYDIQSKEWSQRVSRELRMINDALSNRIMILEKTCPT